MPGAARRLPSLAGGETVVHLTGKGLWRTESGTGSGCSTSVIEGLPAAVFSVGSDGTDGPTDAAGGYVDGDSGEALRENGLSVAAVLQENDAYHALAKIDGLIMTGPTGTNVNDVAVALIQG